LVKEPECFDHPQQGSEQAEQRGNLRNGGERVDPSLQNRKLYQGGFLHGKPKGLFVIGRMAQTSFD
jgi:hypothetical protein